MLDSSLFLIMRKFPYILSHISPLSVSLLPSIQGAKAKKNCSTMLTKFESKVRF